MDSETEQPNSASTPSSTTGSNSNNSSSSNLLVNLPMLPSVLNSQENMDTDNIVGTLNDDNIMSDDAGVNYVAPSLTPNTPSRSPSPPIPPSQLQPQPTTQASCSGQIAANIANNSFFISPLLLNNNSTSNSDTTTTSSTTPSSSSTTTTPLHHEHFTLSSSHQQLPQNQAQPLFTSSPSPSPLLSSSPSTRLDTGIEAAGAVIVPIIREQTPLTFIQNEQQIADTIDASVITPPPEAIFETSSTPIDQDTADDEDGNVVLDTTARQVQYRQQQQEQQQQSPILNIPELPRTPLSSSQSYNQVSSLRPTITTTSLPSNLLENDLRPKYSFSHNYISGSGSGCGSSNNYINYNNNNFNFGNGIIGGTVGNMFSNNDNDSAAAGSSSSGGGGSHRHQQTIDRIKMLYPNVNENDTPLPRCWSPHDKCLSIGLEQNNLRVHYKGTAKNNDSAASVRTAHPIPPACGLYYFEVKIISKGKNGYMGIGLTSSQFRMNRLPGWDKQSYGYHGDDGNSFSASVNGQSYGPTFTTGDIIGCCVNFINNTCFYTKNGIDLGIAFRDLPTRVYPTVGLQTPGEEVLANFGQEPFKFDQIEDMMKQMRLEMTAEIYNFPMLAEQGDPTTLLHKMVISYLVHNGHSETAEAFARATSQSFREDLVSIRNRQNILKLVMNGRMSQAIELTLNSYPGLLQNNKNLLFMLKCRQFVEMVNGSDVEATPLTHSKPSVSNQTTPPNQTSVIQSTKTYQNGNSSNAPPPAVDTNNTAAAPTTTNKESPPKPNAPVIKPGHHNQHIVTPRNCNSDDVQSNDKDNEIAPANLDYNNDVEMENHGHNSSNGDSYQNGNSSNHLNNSLDVDEDMEVDISPASPKNRIGIERILQFGKELSQMGQSLEKEEIMKDEDRQMLEDAFSLIAYSNPWSSPLGWQLCPTKRENICTALNSAILESMSYPRRPPLDVCVGHANELLRLLANAGNGASAFINVEDCFPQH